MATFAQWKEGARPHTWANAWAPVIVGSAAAYYNGEFSWWRGLLALIVSWALIIGVNFSNDYSDGIRGTDEDRTGPLRLTGSGLAAPETVKRAAFICFGVAALAGIVLAIDVAWWLILVGMFCIAGAWFYTGGKNPYGYRGFGEVAVFIFFGLIAVLGTEFIHREKLSWVGLACAVGVGAISAGVNLANNLRDIPTDQASGKITLAVTLGDARTRLVYCLLVATPFIMSILLAFASPWTLLSFAALALVLPAARPVVRGVTGKALIPVIGATGKAMLAWAVLTALGLILG
ncbi:1,4-dihydroxy-2-naphthoateoctaprenyltransferase [Corynebacterium renale]|uniref:1,4-dihydroxy-2-naphthoate polyprenyltransferase n=1 Tax=Corynebacterium renale TaxID=1724 RepID=UPI000DA37212|nr:1,4-dihydroxy-2-naphthoate polyprenyltransferase [Corynebacterium renale]SQG63971.1 1,4-dihydroxy-2-naphthoateoctaprenyltransferase [Corynebacterium renale]STD03296.1 1,4-dihydroxy-2-naphthoateoctaprenyltransferase [Corynebacterium renale]